MHTCVRVLTVCVILPHAQDLTVHTREVHSKLVEIMQERLLLAARQLASESRTWGAVFQQQPQQQQQQQVPTTAVKGFEVSPAVRSLFKQLGTLQSVLVPILQEEEVCGYGGVYACVSRFCA